ncbi:hypothetical protein MSG28_015534 [Choristoneura fumiferana]|uniref:Uncharacterized protein n=1 Tax=Choristoneura fumiferana TaxID=7141 RepID=A0ACC0KB69_CHOFU|nr:hypothetical protein MSG28_015534 [Choristoneura fumiferana]
MQWSHTLSTPTGGESSIAKQTKATELNTDGLTRSIQKPSFNLQLLRSSSHRRKVGLFQIMAQFGQVPVTNFFHGLVTILLFHLNINQALRTAIRVGVVGRATSRVARARCYDRRYELRRVALDYAATEAYKTTIKFTIVTRRPLPPPLAACAATCVDHVVLQQERAHGHAARRSAISTGTDSFTDLGLHDKKMCTRNDSFTDHGCHDKHIKVEGRGVSLFSKQRDAGPVRLSAANCELAWSPFNCAIHGTQNNCVNKHLDMRNSHETLYDADGGSRTDDVAAPLSDDGDGSWKTVEKEEHLNNLSSDSKDDTENEPETTKSMINNKKGTNLEIPTFNREALESENIKDMTNTFNRAISEIKNKINGTMMRKNPDYKHTWRTWEPESESQEDSHLAKLEHQIAARMDSSDNETDSSENTEDLNDLESENTLHLDVDSEISEDKVKKTTDRVTLPIKVTNATTVTSVLNKQPDYNTWRTWKHFIYTNGTTRLPEHVRSTNTKVSDYDEYKYWKNSREAQVKVRRETPPTKHLMLLRGQGLFKIVDGTVVKPEDEKQRTLWEAQDAKAQTLLVTRMSEEVMLHIISCETSAEMWRKLLSVYEQKSETSIHILQQRFFQFKYDEGSDMSVFLSKIQEMQNNLKQMGEEISDKFVITKVLMSLPEDYKHFISAWESASDDKQTYDNLVARLLIEEERIKEKENETGNKVKIFRSDNGTEFLNKDVKELFQARGIVHQTSTPYTPEQNGRAERENRILTEAARTMLCARDLPTVLWAEAVNSAAYIINRTGKSSVDGKSPYELWSGKSYDIHNLKIFGTTVYVHIPKEKRHKWDLKGEKGIMVGYGETTKGFRVYFPHKNVVEIKRDIVFVKEEVTGKMESLEPCMMNEQSEECSVDPIAADLDVQGQSQRAESDSSQLQNNGQQNDSEYDPESTMPSESEGSLYEPSDSDEVGNIEQRSADPQNKRVRKQTVFYNCNNVLLDSSEPKTYSEAMNSADSCKWKEAIQRELQTLKDNNTWSVCDHQIMKR